MPDLSPQIRHDGDVGLAAAINREHRACEEAAASAVEHAYRAGELLLEAKGRVPHGAWLPWLDEHFAGSERLAQTYMKLANELPKAQSSAHLSIDGALKAISAPREISAADDGEQEAAPPTGQELETAGSTDVDVIDLDSRRRAAVAREELADADEGTVRGIAKELPTKKLDQLRDAIHEEVLGRARAQRAEHDVKPKGPTVGEIMGDEKFDPEATWADRRIMQVEDAAEKLNARVEKWGLRLGSLTEERALEMMADAERWVKDVRAELERRVEPERLPKSGRAPEPTTPRQIQIAEKNRDRVNRMVGGWQGAVRGLPDLPVERAAFVASPDELEHWDETARAMEGALRKLRSRLASRPKGGTSTAATERVVNGEGVDPDAA